MKKIKKIILAAIVAGAAVMLLFGCGKKEEQQSEAKGYVWVSEYADFNVEQCDWIDEIVSAGDECFFSTSLYDEEKEQSVTYLYKYNLLENTAEKLNMETEENTSIYGMAVNGEGNLTMLVNHYEYILDDSGEITDVESTMELRTVSTQDGSTIDAREISEVMDLPEEIYFQYFCVDAKDNIYLADSDSRIYVLNKDYQKVCEITIDNWISNMVTSREGDVYVASYGNEGMELKMVDIAAKKLGTPVEGLDEGYGNFSFRAGLDSSFLISTSNGVSTFDIQEKAYEELFKWLDVDVDANDISQSGELSDGRIWAIVREYDRDYNSTFQLIYLSQKDASQVPAKEEIVLGAMWIDSDTKKCIINFNKNNSQYRIVVKEYGEDDYETGLIQFGADMTTGNCPDIISLAQLDFAQFANKGIFEDLYPYMEQSGIKKEDYLENVLKAYEEEGKLYGIMPTFFISSTAVKKSLVGDKSGWTLSEMLDLVDEVNPPYVLTYDSRESMLSYCIYQNIDEFIDWETGNCSFDGEEFIRALEFASRFPSNEEVDYNERESVPTLLHENKLLLMQSSISSVQEYQMMKGMYGEDIVYIGSPTSDAKGNIIYPSNGSFAISSKSKYKDGAWEFIKTLLEAEYQDSLISEHGSWGFPVRIASLEKQFEYDMTADYYEDEEGNQIENPKTTWGYDDFSIEIMAASQEEIDEVKALIMSAEKVTGNADQQIINIITEETEPFFKGQKSATDVASVIQNRVQIYVNENK